MARTLLRWRILGEDLVGTCHVPASGLRSGGSAVLLLNSGPAPRSGNSDLSARIGDRLALRGCAVFRFDLRGLGDSSGSTPADLDSFWSAVVAGTHDEATVELLERIQRELGVARLFVGGLCAAALLGVRALARASTTPAGLLLLEPDFRLAPRGTPEGAGAGARSTRCSGTADGAPRRWTDLRTDVEGRVARVNGRLRALLGSVGRRLRSAWPADANAPLIRDWQAGLARGVDSLVVVAAGQQNERFVARILATLPATARARVTCVPIPGTNHLFTSGGGSEPVVDAIEPWVIERLGVAPACAPERSPERASGSRV